MKKTAVVILCFNLVYLCYGQSTWERTGDFPAGQQKSFAITVTHNGSIIAESRGTGIYRSTNKGTSWELVSSNEKDAACLATAPNGDIYALYTTPYTSVNISRSTNDGVTWVNAYSRSTPNNFYAEGGIAFLPNGHIVAAMERIVGQLVSESASFVLRSTDAGGSWNKIWDDSASGSGSLKNLKAVGTVIYASYSTGVGSTCPVAVSSDEGITWLPSSNSFFAFGRCLAVDSAGVLYAGIGTGDYITEKLFKSTDGGLSFSPGGLPGGSTFTVFAGSNGCIYAATDYSLSPWMPKVRRSTDHGLSWEMLNDGIPAGLKTYAFAQNSDGDVFAATTESLSGTPGGVFVLRNVTGIWPGAEEAPAEFRLEQNYPNPFNPGTVISYSLQTEADVQLTVYNAEGKQVRELVNSRQSAGTHKINFDGSALSSGIYFYRLSSGSNSVVNKMILLK